MWAIWFVDDRCQPYMPCGSVRILRGEGNYRQNWIRGKFRLCRLATESVKRGILQVPRLESTINARNGLRATVINFSQGTITLVDYGHTHAPRFESTSPTDYSISSRTVRKNTQHEITTREHDYESPRKEAKKNRKRQTKRIYDRTSRIASREIGRHQRRSTKSTN